MMSRPVDMVEVGDFVQFRGHRIQEFMQTMWWEATSIDGDTLHLVNRHGRTARMRRTWRYQHCRALVWQSGDPREDD